MELAEVSDYSSLLFLRDDDRHADAHVKSGEHLGIRDISFLLDKAEDRKDPDLASVDMRGQTVRDHAAEIAGDTAAGDVGHAGDEILAGQFF